MKDSRTVVMCWHVGDTELIETNVNEKMLLGFVAKLKSVVSCEC